LALIGTAVIEPASVCDATNSATSGCDNQPDPRAALALQHSDSACLKLASIDADLREIVLAWSAVPVHVRQAIVILARNSGQE